MVLIVVAYVESEQIQRSIVRVSLMALEEHVVLGNKVSRDGMKAHSQHRASQHVKQRLGTQQPIEKNVECKLYNGISDLQLTDGFGIDAQRPDCIKQWLKNNPNELAKASAEEPALKIGRNVHIHTIPTQIAVVVEVVALEGGRVRQTNGQVGKNGEPAIPFCMIVAKRCVVGNFMDG